MSVIDLGGRADSWIRAAVKPAAVHVINLESPPDELPDWIRADVADACELPAQLAGHGYDLVFSNSVIERVGGHVQRMKFRGDRSQTGGPALGADPVPVLSDRAALALPGISVPAAQGARSGISVLASGAYPV
jgi:hypothetical protein